MSLVGFKRNLSLLCFFPEISTKWKLFAFLRLEGHCAVLQGGLAHSFSMIEQTHVMGVFAIVGAAFLELLLGGNQRTTTHF